MRSTVIPCGGIIASASRRNRERTARARFTTGVGGIAVASTDGLAWDAGHSYPRPDTSRGPFDM